MTAPSAEGAAGLADTTRILLEIDTGDSLMGKVDIEEAIFEGREQTDVLTAEGPPDLESMFLE